MRGTNESLRSQGYLFRSCEHYQCLIQPCWLRQRIGYEPVKREGRPLSLGIRSRRREVRGESWLSGRYLRKGFPASSTLKCSYEMQYAKDLLPVLERLTVREDMVWTEQRPYHVHPCCITG